MEKKAIITDNYTADPSVHIFEGKVYLYPSHDLDIDMESNDDGDQYIMTDYHVYSMDKPGEKVTDHGMVLHVDQVEWASKQMWAPDAAEKDGKYYLYFPARDKDGIFRIGVAISDKPYGPFKPNKSYIKNSFSIDPCTFKDKDGQHYMLFGGLWGGQLQNFKTGKYDPKGEEPKPEEKACYPKIAKLDSTMMEIDESPKDIRILDENGNDLLAGDEDRRYFEGPWMHMYNGKYYFSYSTGTTHKIVYAVSDNLYGPYTFKGTILNPVLGWTTHHSIIEVDDQWYLFYHDSTLSKGQDNKRCVKYAKIEYLPDGTIKTIEG